MTDADLHDCLLIIRYGITPNSGGWNKQPLGVGTWLIPTQMCLDELKRQQES